MRKLLLFVFIVFSFAAFTQETVNMFEAQYGVWNGEEWELSDPMDVDIDFRFDDNLITANDEAQSAYFTYSVLSDDGITVQWKAVDERLEECVVIMSVEDDYFVLIVMYVDRLYKYHYHFE